MFITDFDGTLLRDDRTIRAGDLERLCRLKEQGVVVVIATGRSLYSFHRALEAMKTGLESNYHLWMDYLIFSTGSGIMEAATKNLIKSLSIPAEQIPEITKLLDSLRLDYMVHQAIPHTRKFLYRQYDKKNADFNRRLAIYPDDAGVLQKGAVFANPATEVLAILPPEKVSEEVMNRLVSELEKFSVIRASSPLDHRSVWMEIFHKEVSKSRAASWLARRLDIEASDVLAVGNDYNDLDLLEWAGRGVMVGNAPPELKKRLLSVRSNNEGGVSDAAALLFDQCD